MVLANKKDYRLTAGGYNIKSFRMLIIYKGKVVDLKSNSNKLTEKMKFHIKKLEDGNILSFHKIIVIDSKGEDVKLGSLALKIKNNI